MSVNSYLEKVATNAVLPSPEKMSIGKSIQTLQSRLTSHFNNLKEHFQFGSSTRGTILPRAMDEHSDIDYMVVFNDSGFSPQTYLDRLRKFVEKYYGSSEIRQSTPTIVLELNHIKFELVPATHNLLFGYQIPDGSGGWQSTNPNDFNQTLIDKNKNNENLIKPTIRLAKYWNAKNSYVFDSYLFEKHIVDLGFFWCQHNHRDFLFNVMDNLPSSLFEAQWRKDKMARAKAIVDEVRNLERKELFYAAETEIQRLIPE